jgi:hydroxyacylglutathione hydrolase
MKKTLVLLSLIAIISICESCKNKSIETTWLKVKEVADKVWQISDNGDDNMYLVEGRDSAMLIDTGLGVADLTSVVNQLTKKPLIVVNTHAHPDHSGANYQFEKIYIHPADLEDAKPYSKPRQMPAGAQQQTTIPEAELYKGTIHDPVFVPLSDGQIFDLGGRRIEIIHAPGHSAGEICLLDKENKLLFTGDNTNALVWLWLPTCRPLSEYLVTLEMLEKRGPEYTTIFPGHNDPLPGDFIKDQIACVKGILDGSLERKPYEMGGGQAQFSVYNGATVVFNPDNL